MLNQKRLFSFGCSFTRYRWPTWADILGAEFDQHENWGQLGAGNNYIANSVVECCLSQQINPTDTVIVQWSSPLREDRYVGGRWVSVGNIFSKEQKIYDSNFVNSMIDVRGCYVRDLALMLMTKKLLDSYGCHYVFFSMSNIITNDATLIELLLNYQEVIDCVRPSVMQSLFNNDWNSRPWPNEYSRDYQNLKTRYDGCAGPDWPTFPELVESKLDQVAQHIKDEIFNTKIWNWSNEVGKIKRHDPHPTPAEHLEYLDRELKEFNISQKTRELVNVIEQQVQNFEPLLDWQPQFKTAYPVRW